MAYLDGLITTRFKELVGRNSAKYQVYFPATKEWRTRLSYSAAATDHVQVSGCLTWVEVVTVEKDFTSEQLLPFPPPPYLKTELIRTKVDSDDFSKFRAKIWYFLFVGCYRLVGLVTLPKE